MNMFDETSPEDSPEEMGKSETNESTKKLVLQLTQKIKADKRYFADAFKQMRIDMQIATFGCEKDWDKQNYVANYVGSHINRKTERLYAKNPKAEARRAESMDFALWDEDVKSLQMAMQASQMLSQLPPQQSLDPMTGQIVQMPPQIPPELQQAQAVVQDAMQGMEKRKLITKFGKTLEILFSHALRQQNPVDFKTSMKQAVRRACTTAVAYIEVGFQRAYGLRLESQNKLADSKMRLEHLKALAEEINDGEITDPSAEIAELQAGIAALETEQDVLLREGLVFDFPPTTRVIPDRLCKNIVGFIGASHLTVEYLYTPNQVREIFGIDLENQFSPYRFNAETDEKNDYTNENFVADDVYDDQDQEQRQPQEKRGMVCVWKHFDKPSGLVYYLADGYKDFLKPPAAPDVKVDDFFPVRALTFNQIENEALLFPPSDVYLLTPMQREINRSREGQREHRSAARPRWVYANGSFEEEDIENLEKCEAMSAISMNFDPSVKIADILQTTPVPGVDPNLYDTNQYFNDMTLVVGAQASQFGGMDKGTATAASIAADVGASAASSGVDDLDAFLTWVARSSSQILLQEMSPETVQKIVGVGAVWAGLNGVPPMDMAMVAEELYLDIEAGSTGKPNRAIEIQTWKEMLPFLIQMGSIPSEWLARETLRRADDRMDLTEAVVAGLPSILAQNRMAQMSTGNPETDPNQQGDTGGDKSPAPRGSGGGEVPMGSNNGKEKPM